MREQINRSGRHPTTPRRSSYATFPSPHDATGATLRVMFLWPNTTTFENITAQSTGARLLTGSCTRACQSTHRPGPAYRSPAATPRSLRNALGAHARTR